MTITVIGTPDSGKSKKAEDIVCNISGAGERYYIATMIPYGDEGAKRVEKHRHLREGKGFITIEQPMNVSLALEKIEKPDSATVLLECMSNLAANEMFEGKENDLSGISSRIAEDVRSIQAAVKNLIIVSNRFDEDPAFDDETKRYVMLMDMVNGQMKNLSDECIII